MSNDPKHVTSRAQAGFTLIEMVVVVAVIGVLIALVAPSLTSSRDGANSKLMSSVAQQAANNLSLLANAAGLAPNTTFAADGKTLPDVLFAGKDSVKGDYQKYWDQAGLLPIKGGVVQDTTQCKDVTGNYKVANYCVGLSANESTLTVTYTGLTLKLAEKLAQQADPAATFVSSDAPKKIGELTLAQDGSNYKATYDKTIR